MTPKVVLGLLREGPKATPKPTWDQNGNGTNKKHKKVENTPPPQPFDLFFDQHRNMGQKDVLRSEFFAHHFPNRVVE